MCVIVVTLGLKLLTRANSEWEYRCAFYKHQEITVHNNEENV